MKLILEEIYGENKRKLQIKNEFKNSNNFARRTR